MERYCILVLKRQGEEVEVLKEMLCAEERAIRECCRIFRSTGVQKVVLVNEAIQVVFKDTRRCRCTKIQQEFYPDATGNIMYRDVCVDCGIVIEFDAWTLGQEEGHQVERMIK